MKKMTMIPIPVHHSKKRICPAMEGTCLVTDIVKSFIHSEVFENVEERGLSVRGWWVNPFWEENVLKNEEICAGREKEHTGTKGTSRKKKRRNQRWYCI